MDGWMGQLVGSDQNLENILDEHLCAEQLHDQIFLLLQDSLWFGSYSGFQLRTRLTSHSRRTSWKLSSLLNRISSQRKQK